jgi:hypothetical protein
LSYQQITLAQLNVLLQARFDNNNSFWTDFERQTALNEALSLFQLSTGRWRQRYIVTTVAKRCFYSIPDLPQLQVSGICQVLQPIRVSFNGSPPLGWSSFADMDLTYPGWQAQTTAMPEAPSTPQMCGPAGVNLMFIWPADAVGNNSLALDVITNSPQLVNSGEFVNLDNTEIVRLLDYGEFRLSLKRGGIFFARTLPLLQGFLKMLADRNAYLMNISIFRQMTGADFARNYSPRRIGERNGQPIGLGAR